MTGRVGPKPTLAASGEAALERLRPLFAEYEAADLARRVGKGDKAANLTRYINAGRAIEAAIRAESADPYDSLNEHRRQSDAGTHLFDDACYFCRAEAGTLDVKRLARALCNTAQTRVNGPAAEPDYIDRETARIIAAEYARLAEADRPKPTFNPFELDAIPDD